MVPVTTPSTVWEVIVGLVVGYLLRKVRSSSRRAPSNRLRTVVLLAGGPGAHDVDEALLLADKIFLMTNGPGAVLAEVPGLPDVELQGDD